MITLMICIFAGGVAGGTANFLLLEPSPEKPRNLSSWLGLAAIGVIAAAVVPLFLSLTDSVLVDSIIGSANDTEELRNSSVKGNSVRDSFVFFGLCIAAAFSSRAFLETMSKKLMEKVEVAETKAAQANQLADKALRVADRAQDIASEGVDPGVVTTERIQPSAEAMLAANATNINNISDVALSVLRATAKRSHRTRTGVANDTGLSYETVDATMEDLEKEGLIELTSTSSGSVRRRVTPKGIALLNRAAGELDK